MLMVFLFLGLIAGCCLSYASFVPFRSCALVPGLCRGVLPEENGCLKQSKEVASQDVITSQMVIVGQLKLLYSPHCKSVFAYIELTRRGSTKISIQVSVHHPKYTEIYDSGVISAHEVYSVLVPVSGDTTISASGSIDGGGTTFIGQTPDILFYQ